MLPAGGSCLLGSLNLAEFVHDCRFDFDDFAKSVKTAVVALNEVLDEGIPLHPLKEQRDSVSNWRQIGLGIFGLADMLIKLGIKYGSPEAISLCDRIGFSMADAAISTSAILAKECGTYPKYNRDAILKSPYLQYNTSLATQRLVAEFGLRNSQLLTIAPTGSLSTMIGVSGGIEPIFANYYTRKTESLHNEEKWYKVYTPIVAEYMKNNGISDDKELPEYFVTAQDLNYVSRIDMQAIWQDHIDASISSTANVSNTFSVKDVEDLYIYAWVSGLKGVTLFRDGCKRAGVLTTTEQKEGTEHEQENSNELKRGEIISTDDSVIGLKRKLITGCGSLHCQAFFEPHNGKFREIYLSKGSTGGCNNFMIGLSRMISLAARSGVSLDDIVDQLMSTGACPSYAKRGKSKGSCCPMAIGFALKDMQKQFKESFTTNVSVVKIPANSKLGEEQIQKNQIVKNVVLCPECGEELIFEGGCNICKSCGWSKCD